MLMTKYTLRKKGLRPAKGQKPLAYTTFPDSELYELEKAVPIKKRPVKENPKDD